MNNPHKTTGDTVSEAIEKIAARIVKAGDKQHVSVARQLELLDQLSKFDLGLFLIQNGGVNGHWTHYILMHPRTSRLTGKNNRGEVFSDLEKNILDDFPSTVATQQRFDIFIQENQKAVKDRAKLACIPCGMMGELLYLDYTDINDFALVGIDIDFATMEHARNLACSRKLGDKIRLLQEDAWKLGISGEFDLISSNGLNIYVPEAAKVTELYKQFYQALVPGGKLVTSFVTYPPSFPDKTEWKMEYVDPEVLLLQRIVFIDILDAKFNCFMTTKQMTQSLGSIGFKDICIFQDKANIFPTLVARK